MTIEAMIEQALRLSVEDRTELVARLLESLDEASADPGREAAWTEVIDRRVQDLQEAASSLSKAASPWRAREAVAAAAARKR